MSVLQVSTPELCDMDTGRPKRGGLLDPLLGTVDKDIRCESCHSDMMECPGHFGSLELAKPTFHYGFLKTVLDIMRCVCFHCQTLLVSKV